MQRQTKNKLQRKQNAAQKELQRNKCNTKKNSANIIATQNTATQTKQNYIAKSASHKNAKITAAQKKLHRNKTAAPKNCSTKTLQYKQTNNQTKLLHKKLATQTLQCKLQHKKLQCKKNWNAAGIVKLPPSGPQTSTTTRLQPALNHRVTTPTLPPESPGNQDNATKTAIQKTATQK